MGSLWEFGIASGAVELQCGLDIWLSHELDMAKICGNPGDRNYIILMENHFVADVMCILPDLKLGCNMQQ